MIIYIDLDRTLLDTARFHREIWSWVERQYDIDGQAELSRVLSFYTYKGNMRMYDFFAHARDALALDEADLADFKNKLRADMRCQDFLFPRTGEALCLLKNIGECQILTFGEDEYQRFKTECCPGLNGLPITVVQQPKGDYFRSLPGETLRMLIDDMLVFTELPKGVEFIHIDAAQQETIRQHAGFVSARSLYDAAVHACQKGLS